MENKEKILASIEQGLSENRTFVFKGSHNLTLWGLTIFFFLGFIGTTIGFVLTLTFETYSAIIIGVFGGFFVGFFLSSIMFRIRELTISPTGVYVKIIIQVIGLEYINLKKIELKRSFYRQKGIVFHPTFGRKVGTPLGGFVDENKQKIENEQIEQILKHYAKNLILEG